MLRLFVVYALIGTSLAAMATSIKPTPAQLLSHGEFKCVLSYDDDTRLQPEYVGELVVGKDSARLTIEPKPTNRKILKGLLSFGANSLPVAAKFELGDYWTTLRIDTDGVLPGLLLQNLTDMNGLFVGELHVEIMSSKDAITGAGPRVVTLRTFEAQCELNK